MSYRVSTPEERAKRQAEVNKRCEYIMMLKAQGLNYATIACRLGLSPSQVSKIARDYIHRMHP